MGAMFALAVRTGRELQAFEMMKYKLNQAGESIRSIVKKIHLNNTSFQVLSSNSKNVDTDGSVNYEDKQTELRIQNLNTSIANRRLQLESIEKYRDNKFEKEKEKIKQEIREIQKEVSALRRGRKRIKSVLSGYVIVELAQNSTYLPDFLWHFFNDIPLVSMVLSRDPIPQEEMDYFMEMVEEKVEPTVVMAFEKEKENEELEKEASELVYEANKKETSSEKQKELFEKIDNLYFSVVEKMEKFIEEKRVNKFISKISAFIMRKRETVSVPLSLLDKIYTSKELQHIGEILNGKDFIRRFEILLGEMAVFE